jgi:hypothetical protein
MFFISSNITLRWLRFKEIRSKHAGIQLHDETATLRVTETAADSPIQGVQTSKDLWEKSDSIQIQM